MILQCWFSGSQMTDSDSIEGALLFRTLLITKIVPGFFGIGLDTIVFRTGHGQRTPDSEQTACPVDDVVESFVEVVAIGYQQDVPVLQFVQWRIVQVLVGHQ